MRHFSISINRSIIYSFIFTFICGFIFSSAFLMMGAPSAFSSDQFIDSSQPVIRITTDAKPGLECILALELTSSQALTGVTYDCAGAQVAVPHGAYSLAQIQAGFVLYHDDKHDVDVATLSAPGFDANKGGVVVIHYLYDYLSSEYRDFQMTLSPQAAIWRAFDAKNQLFNEMFLVKNTAFGATVGVADVQTSEKN